MNAVDLFAGPGGWDLGARTVGLDPVGIELDEAACATRAAAGLRTVQADVAALDPAVFGPCDLLIGSPPCPTFSTAGDQQGALLTDLIVACGREILEGRDTRAVRVEEAYGILLPGAKSPERARRDAAMSLLVVEPLRWLVELRPRLVALEQVPPVLPLWRMFAGMLEQRGYRAWCGVLNAADYGVPQTRRRAFLLAHLGGPVVPPEPTHCKGGRLSLDGELLPWVSMAEALGWTGSEIVTTRGERDPGTGGNEFCADEPSWAMTGRARPWTARGAEPAATITGAMDNGNLHWVLKSRRDSDGQIERHGERPNRTADEPAPTLTGEAWRWPWTATDEGQLPLLHTNRGQGPDGTRQTISTKAGGQWYWDAPSTTVAGDPRVTSRSHHEHGEQGANAVTSEQARAGDYDGRSAIRITLAEAATLQGFPADHPWQGSRTKQFEQVGNAVPPPLAAHVLRALVG